MQESHRQSWDRVLRDAAIRNGRVSLRKSFNGEESLAPPRLPSRLLELGKDGSIVIERPLRPGAAKLCQPGVRVDLLLPDGQQCWAGRCTTIEAFGYALNRATSVHAVRLAPPVEVWSAQRRRFFRVDTADENLPRVGVLAVPDPSAAPPQGLTTRDRFEAAVHDLSGGGIGLRVEAQTPSARRLQSGDAVRCFLRLPDDAQPLELPGTVRRCERVGSFIHLGIAFVCADPADQRRIEDRLTRYATQLERLQLQRRRGA